MATFIPLLLTVLVAVSCQAAPDVYAKDGEVKIGKVSGGSFGPGSFSVGEPGRGVNGGAGGQGDPSPNPPHVTGDGSIAIDNISGGNYPDNSYSIGHGQDSYGGQGVKATAAPDSAVTSKLSSLCSLLVVLVLSIYA